MCGIAGILDTSRLKGDQVLKALALRMADMLGPTGAPMIEALGQMRRRVSLWDSGDSRSWT